MFWALWLEVVWGKDNSWSGTLQGQRECNNLTSASFQTIKKNKTNHQPKTPKSTPPPHYMPLIFQKGLKSQNVMKIIRMILRLWVNIFTSTTISERVAIIILIYKIVPYHTYHAWLLLFNNAQHRSASPLPAAGRCCGLLYEYLLVPYSPEETQPKREVRTEARLTLLKAAQWRSSLIFYSDAYVNYLTDTAPGLYCCKFCNNTVKIQESTPV